MNCCTESPTTHHLTITESPNTSATSRILITHDYQSRGNKRPKFNIDCFSNYFKKSYFIIVILPDFWKIKLIQLIRFAHMGKSTSEWSWWDNTVNQIWGKVEECRWRQRARAVQCSVSKAVNYVLLELFITEIWEHWWMILQVAVLEWSCFTLGWLSNSGRRGASSSVAGDTSTRRHLDWTLDTATEVQPHLTLSPVLQFLLRYCDEYTIFREGL